MNFADIRNVAANSARPAVRKYAKSRRRTEPPVIIARRALRWSGLTPTYRTRLQVGHA